MIVFVSGEDLAQEHAQRVGLPPITSEDAATTEGRAAFRYRTVLSLLEFGEPLAAAEVLYNTRIPMPPDNEGKWALVWHIQTALEAAQAAADGAPSTPAPEPPASTQFQQRVAGWTKNAAAKLQERTGKGREG